MIYTVDKSDMYVRDPEQYPELPPIMFGHGVVADNPIIHQRFELYEGAITQTNKRGMIITQYNPFYLDNDYDGVYATGQFCITISEELMEYTLSIVPNRKPPNPRTSDSKHSATFYGKSAVYMFNDVFKSYPILRFEVNPEDKTILIYWKG